MSGALASDHLGPLSPGDKVALLTVSGQPSAARLEGAKKIIAGMGLEPEVLPTCTLTHPRADYLAGTDEQRAADFTSAWTDPGTKAIVCVRGGYGSVRVLDLLDAEQLSACPPKPLYGSSDVTALHEWVMEELGVATWFTPMPATGDLADDEVALDLWRDALLTPWQGMDLSRGDERRSLVGGKATGRLIGGNLSLLAMTLSARNRRPIDNAGCLVLLEDVGEDIYKYDGYLQQLLRSGWFDGVAGIVLGSWKGSDPTEARELCAELLEPLAVPLVSDFDFGHGPGAMSLPLGVLAELTAGDEPTLRLVP